jgi:uncharacterized membrane protein YbhN (UPF0104 family)
LRRRGLSLLLVACGLALTVVLLVVARPAEILALAGRSRLGGVLAGAGCAAGILLARGLRLASLTVSRLSSGRAVAVVAVSQVATAVLPLRLGDVATVGLLHLGGVGGPARSLSVALALRLLDALTLLVFCCAVLPWLGFPIAAPLALLGALALALALVVALGDRALRRLASTRSGAGPRRRRVLRSMLRARRELRDTLRAPRRVAAATAFSFVAWGGVWLQTSALLGAMALRWPPDHVLVGVLGASLGASLPLNSVGSFGSMEAGWVAALAALGHDPAVALRAGFATHLWSVVFTIAFGAVAVGFLAASHPGSRRRIWRAWRSAERNTPTGP